MDKESGKSQVTLIKILVLLMLVVVIVITNVLISRYNRKYREMISTNEFIRILECAPTFDEDPDATFRISFEAAAEKPGVLRVYQQSIEGEKYFIEYQWISVGTEYSTYTIDVKPVLINPESKSSMLALYGEYGSGVIPKVRNVTIAKLND